MNLVIVESPAKTKTLKQFLGKDFEIMASYGHIRDLIPKTGAIDTDNNFEMKYELLDSSKKQVNKIISLLKKADNLYLATDPDREGEAISWHLYEILKEKNLLEGKKIYRVAFHEITKHAVTEAIQNPRQLSDALVNAQQARRALDYLVGFNLSPLLWRKIKTGLSAGRVQSPALRLIAEREEEIEAFKPREYWTVDALLSKASQDFPAQLFAINGERVKQFDINNETQAGEIRQEIESVSQSGLTITKVNKKQRQRRPVAPFTTSTLQQDAVRKLGLSTSNAMRIAQQLYEGIDLGNGPIGLITYMRTDSVSLSNEAIHDIRTHIRNAYGNDYLPEKPNFYKAKSKNTQEAHEAIRPTQAALTPDSVKSALDARQLQLYGLIWKRAVASQMTPAVYDTVSADIEAGKYLLRANGSTIKEPGYLKVYQESLETNSTEGDDKKSAAEKDTALPPLEEKEIIPLKRINAEQHFTEPPPRFSEASLVKTLEEYDIGRPSTYASIISTLQNRGYAELNKKRFFPTDVGRIVSRFLSEHFAYYVDYKYTANLEDKLDEISRGESDWIPMLKDFWQPFKDLVDDKNENLTRSDVIQPRQLGTDPKSGKPVNVKLGRYGPYVQIGSREDVEKPLFAGLRPGQKMDTITLEQALPLFDLPRHIGETPEGEVIEANIGRFGPYLKYNNQYASLREDDPHTIELPRALEVIAAKKQADKDKILQEFVGEKIQILKGRWGPFVTDGDKKVRLPKDADAKNVTLQECQKLLAAAPASKKAAAKRKTVKKRTVKKKSTRKKAVKKKSQ